MVLFKFDMSAHEFDDALSNRQTEPGTFLAANSRRLFEWLKDALLITGGNAASGVLNLEAKYKMIVGICMTGTDPQSDRSLLCILDRIAEEIDQHFTQPGSCVDVPGKLAGLNYVQREMLLGRSHAHHVGHIVHNSLQITSGDFQ